MIIQPKIRGFVCTTAHPTGCAYSVQEQIRYMQRHSIQPSTVSAKRVLVIGASTGYGLASRIAATYGLRAATIGVMLEKPASDKRTASAGWYHTAAFEHHAHQDGYYAVSVNQDAFADHTKSHVIDLIRRDLQKVDLVIYSIASPRRTDPVTGQIYSSTLKPIGHTFTEKTVDAFGKTPPEVQTVTLLPATTEEIDQTVAVMGGSDWERWLDFLADAEVLEDAVQTIAYSYIGPPITYPIYHDGTIGRAKADLKNTALRLNERLAPYRGQALISINKVIVTQASAAIPIVPLYIAVLFKIMKQQGTHEGCIEQIHRLFRDHLYTPTLSGSQPDDIRLDDLELDEAVQQEVRALWPRITTDNIEQLTDIAGYRHDFYNLFGFNHTHIDYQTEVDPNIAIPSLHETEPSHQ